MALQLENVQLDAESDPVDSFLQKYDSRRTMNEAHEHTKALEQNLCLDGVYEAMNHYKWLSIVAITDEIFKGQSDQLSDPVQENNVYQLSERGKANHREYNNASSAMGFTLDATSAITDSNEMLEMRALRLLSLLKCRQVNRAAQEFDEPNPTSKVSVADMNTIAFELRVLKIEVILRKASNNEDGLVELYELLEEYNALLDKVDLSMSSEVEISGESQRTDIKLAERNIILTTLIHHHLMYHHYQAAVDRCKELVRYNRNSAQAFYLLSRVCCFVGKSADARLSLKLASSRSDASLSMQHLCQAMIYGVEGKVDLANDEFEAVCVLQADNVIAANNSAMMMLHQGLIDDSIERLEGLLRENSTAALDEGLVFNLCTLYELRYPHQSAEKRNVLRNLATRLGRQGFNMKSI